MTRIAVRGRHLAQCVRASLREVRRRQFIERMHRLVEAIGAEQHASSVPRPALVEAIDLGRD